MRNLLVAFTAASVIAAPAAFAVDVDFGGDGNVEGYMLSSGTPAPNDKAMGGWSQRIRAKMHFKGDGGVAVNTRLNITDQTWAGDAQAGTVGAYQNQANGNVNVDYAFIQAPVAGWTLRAGRQEANWGFCLTTCDDRRDRVMFLRKFGSTTVLALYDKRAEGADTFANDPFDVDRDMYGLAGVGVNNGWLWGALLAVWVGDQNLLDGMTLLGGFAKGKIGSVGVKGAVHYLGGSDFPSTTGALYSDSTFSGFVEGTFGLGSVNLAAQWIFNIDGGLITGGIDTYSMFINNSPDNNRSNTNAVNIGSTGVNGLDQNLIAVKISGSSGMIDWYGSAGYYVSDNNGTDSTYTFLQAGGAYNLTKATNLYADLGILGDDDAAANTVERTGFRAGINTSF